MTYYIKHGVSSHGPLGKSGYEESSTWLTHITLLMLIMKNYTVTLKQ